MLKKCPESPPLDLRAVIDRLSKQGLLEEETQYKAENSVSFERLYTDSRELDSSSETDSLFVCIKGHAFDSHQEVSKILSRDNTWVIAEKDLLNQKHRSEEKILHVTDSRLALAHLASLFANDVATKMDLYGVTGTNGKTSVTHILENILNQRWKTKSTSTIQQALTTPGPIWFNQTLLEWHKQGFEKAVIEVSSHGLDQRRVDFIPFKGAIFTNLSPEHMDYHKSMEAYYQAKKRLFSELLYGPAVICTDTTWGERLYEELRKEISYPVVSYSLKEASTWKPTNSKSLLPINVSNLLGSARLAQELGLHMEHIENAVENMGPIPGRLEEIHLSGAGFKVIVDFAHTPAALEAVLKSLRTMTRKRLLVLFGCGGDRDKQKRTSMGAIASSLADHVFLTSDNPRLEDPETILKEIENGVPTEHRTKVTKKTSRKEALKTALKSAQNGDLLVIAGRGHETHQIIRDPDQSGVSLKTPFKDSDQVQKIWEDLKLN